MNVIIFGASGMVGQGVLRECLLDERVGRVLVIGRTGTGVEHAKLRELVQADTADLSAVADELAEYDACFFCLGVSAAGMSEDAYRAITYDLTLAVARPLAEANHGLVFCYVSGAGTDSSEQGRAMWARVKGRTENELLRLPFRAHMFRPGFIQPLHGAVSKTRFYRIAYTVLGPVLPLIRRLAPNHVTSTEQLARAMLAVATAGPVDPADTPHVLDPAAINRLAAQHPA
ncbi:MULTISPECIES: NAD-dependent epimerase/dehydratase family protein [Streptacidiphilus]|uniref:NAD-dependent epimerase/dehydratase family protein n=1 Tax=Streptacidiphilus cavernicola TaxID=3342716 RepID=A0ABV6URW4_9ACTN|nr:NAD-dependent epimerase/dehydratase family protein [Streptacidiphilus jeojiense]